MFKTLKYFFLASLYKKTKKSFTMLFVYFIGLVLFTFFISDLLSIATGSYLYIVITLKWTVIPTLLLLLFLTLIKIINIASKPFDSNKSDEKPLDSKKENILSKEKLYTQSDLILQKYLRSSNEKK